MQTAEPQRLPALDSGRERLLWKGEAPRRQAGLVLRNEAQGRAGPCGRALSFVPQV